MAQPPRRGLDSHARDAALTTGAIPHGDRTFEIEFDFCAHELHIQLLGGDRRAVTLEPKSVARFRFAGKVSPVHFFWGGMDMALTRFSGRPAPRHPGGSPNVGDWVMVEGYSHELSSCGFWPGGDGEGAFYAYAYPEPDGFKTHPVTPEQAAYVQDAGQFLLPYDAVRTASDPNATLLGFLQTT